MSSGSYSALRLVSSTIYLKRNFKDVLKRLSAKYGVTEDEVITTYKRVMNEVIKFVKDIDYKNMTDEELRDANTCVLMKELGVFFLSHKQAIIKNKNRRRNEKVKEDPSAV